MESNSDLDHLHILVSIPPKISVARFVNILKTNAANGIKREFEFLKKVYWGTESIWSTGYFVSSIEIKEDIGRAELELRNKVISTRI